MYELPSGPKTKRESMKSKKFTNKREMYNRTSENGLLPKVEQTSFFQIPKGENPPFVL